MLDLYWLECPDCKWLGKVPGVLNQGRFLAMDCIHPNCREGIIITDDGQQVLDFIRMAAEKGWPPFEKKT